MPIIQRLAPDVASLIAAGEVVDRPASVVKELVENALDAGALSVQVDIEEGGRRLIAVTDDGCGMDAQDAAMAIERYATSKIALEGDLWKLTTMGFRGEAIHSIAQVSRLVIETRLKDAIEGTRVECEGGVSPRSTAAGCPPGTHVEARDLFFNTPARQKFLKSAAVEFGHVSAQLTSIALAHPSVSFDLKHNGKRAWMCHAAHDPAERMGLVVARDEMDMLVPIGEAGPGLGIRGWIGDERCTRASPKAFHIFVNLRPVRDRLLMHGVAAGFEAALDRGRFPVAAVFIDIDPAMVDVNVHPAKREVRFENGPAVHDFIQAAVRKTLHRSRQERSFGSHARSTRMDEGDASVGRSDVASGVARAIERFEARRELIDAGDGHGFHPFSTHATHTASTAMPPAMPQAVLIPDAQVVRAIGQIDRSFIVCEDAGGSLMIVDQHAAHEKLGYLELMRQFKEGAVEQQRLLFPLMIELTDAEMAAFENAQEAFVRAGFDAEPFSAREIVVKAVPALVGDADLNHLVEVVLHDMATHGSSTELDDRVQRIIATVACHRQVRAGDTLTREEMQRLVDDIVRQRIDSCPHGRPAVVRFERKDIDTWFKR